MSSGDLSIEVQEAIFRLLTEDQVMRSLIEQRVYDFVNPKADFPYVQIGDDTAVDGGDKTVAGQDMTLTLHIWTRERSNVTVKKIRRRINELIHQRPLNLVNGVVVLARFNFGATTGDPDGVSRHGVVRYRFLVAEPNP